MTNIFAWVFDIIKDFRAIFIRALIISIVLNLLGLAMPIAMMAITDRVIVYQGFSTLQILLLGLFILNFFEVILSFIRTYLLTHTSLCISLETSVKIYEKLLSLKVEYFDNKPVGKTMNLLQEVHHIKDFLIDAPITILIDIVFAVIFLFVIFSIEPALSLVVLLIIPVHIGVSILVTHIREFYLKEQFRIAGLNQSSLIETISSIQTVKLMSIEQSLKNLWISQTNQAANISFKIIKIESIANLFTGLFDKFSNILILYIGANKVMHNEITLGTLLAFNAFSSYVIGPLVNLAGLWKSIQQLALSATRLEEIFNAPIEQEVQQNNQVISQIQGDITLKNVYFHYPYSSHYTLQEFTLKIKAGEMLGIMGSSGSGKSTLTKLIQGLYLPTRGQILIDHHNLTSGSVEIRKFIGSVPQESFLFSRTVAENIAIGKPDATLEEIQEAAKMAGIHEFIDLMPLKYNSIIEERGINLSGGQRQRIAIARSLILNPQILIFDEATSALDHESEKIIYNNMKQIAKNRTMIVVSHRVEAFKDANRVIVLSDGRILKEYEDMKLFFAEQSPIYEK